MDSIATSTHKLGFAYEGGRQLFADIDFELHLGEIAAVCGASGCGKSTFTQVLVGILPELYGGRLQGSRELFGEDVSQLRLPDMADRLFMVFQEPSAQLFSPTAEDELCFAPENLCWQPSLMDTRLTAALQRAGMSDFRFASPNALSGGQQQKLSLACAFTVQPKLYILDEAFSQLDTHATEELLAMTQSLAEEGNAVLMVEHSSQNMRIAHTVYRMEQGRLNKIKG